MQIKEINHGIGSRIGNIVYLNKKLNKYPKLKKAILDHELSHSDKFNKKDIEVDLYGKGLEEVKLDYYKFILKHPSSISMFFPVWIYEERLVFDVEMIILWILIIGIILGAIWLPRFHL